MVDIYSIQNEDIANGPGVRGVIFFAGCEKHCLGCHNEDTWKRSNGTPMTDAEVISNIASSILNQSVTFSGGEPLLQYKDAFNLAKKLSAIYPDMILFTGYTLEELKERIKEDYQLFHFLCNFRYIVAGPFVLAERDLTLAFRGSRNQKIYELIGKKNMTDLAFLDITEQWDIKYGTM